MKFDDKIKEAVKQYKVEYNPNHWKAVEKSLPAKVSALAYIGAGLVVVAIAGAILLSADSEPIIKEMNQTSPLEELQTTPVPETESVNSEEYPVYADSAEEQPILEEEILPVEEEIIDTDSGEELSPEEELHMVKSSPFKVSLKKTKERVCAKEAIKFGVSTEIPCTYSWDFGDGESSNTPEPLHNYSNEGEYGVFVTLTSLLDGSVERVEYSKGIKVYPKPKAQFSYEVLSPKEFAQRVELKATGKDISDVKWEVFNQTKKGNNTAVEINKAGSYPVKFIVWNSHHCSDTMVKEFFIEKEYNLLAPNAFTPNGDGDNETFMPEALKNIEGEFRFLLQVLDPSTGQVVFQTDDYNAAWNGENMTTGAKATPKTYTWVANLTVKGNKKRAFKGNIRLME
jgi:PKD repeat protein